MNRMILCGALSCASTACVAHGEPLHNLSLAALPQEAVGSNTMDCELADLDGDGLLDVVIALEGGANRVLFNNGDRTFRDGVDAFSPVRVEDSEDIALADFDGDGNLDVAFVSEDSDTHELYLGDGAGGFRDASGWFPMGSTANAVIVIDLNNDGRPDLIVGNTGQNLALMNTGEGFVDDTAARLPAATDSTQDLELGDVNGDGFLDLVVGNEDGNALLFGSIDGVFTPAPEGYFPAPMGSEMTREADLGDIDGDGDLDLYLANVVFTQQAGFDTRDRLLLNDGSGRFTDVSDERIPRPMRHTVDADFVDLDGDGDLDLIGAFSFPGGVFVAINAGGVFTDRTAEYIPSGAAVNGIDVEAGDLDGDGALDLYYTGFQGADQVFFGSSE